MYFDQVMYCTSTIITHGLYIVNPLFEGQKCLLKGLFFLKFWPYVQLVFKRGLWILRIQYIKLKKVFKLVLKKLSSILIRIVKNCNNQRHFWPAGSWGGTFIISICKWNATSSMVGNQVNSWYDCRISIQLFGFNGGD